MRSLKISEDIIPLGEFKTNAASIIKDLAQRENPLVITQHGRPACVIMSPAEFDRMQEREAFLKSVALGLADIESGKVIPDDQLGELLDAEFGVVEHP